MNDEYIKIVKKFDVFSEGIKCLLCGEYSIAKLLFNKIERSNQEIEFFRKIDVFLDDNRSNFDLESSEITKIRWMFECFAFGLIKKHNDFSIDCALITFSQSNDYVTAIFKPFLLDLYPIPKMSDHLANEFAKALFNFYAKYTSMFRILKPFFHSMIIEVNDNRLFKLLNHSAYYLYQNIPVKYLSIDNFQNKEIKNIIYYTQNTKELLIFQTDFSNKFFYPNEFPVSFNSSACSMALSSIHLGVHFVDLFSQLIKEKIEKVDLDTIPNIAKVIPEFVPFLFAAYQPLIYRFPNKYLRLISAELPILNEFSFKIKELQHRFISDIIIQKLYEKLNIIDISIDCFSKNSIPYHFYGFYDQIVCNSFENRSFYIYSDHEKNCDYDFLHSNYAINEFIILIGSNSHESRRSMIQKHFDNIEKHMKMIKNDFTRQITSTDLFSLIFLRDSNNSFLCHPAFALILIKLLRNLSPNDQFLLKSEFIMSQNYTDNKYIDITSYFTGNLTNLLELLGQKKWDIADHMTKYSSKKFRHIFLLSRSIELHGSSQACLFDCNEVQSMLNIELLLTNNNLCQNHMKSICNCSIKNSNDFINPNSPFLATMNDNLKIILENRLKIEAKYIFSPYTSFMWKDAELIARSFDTNPLNFIYSRKIQQFTEKPPTNSSFMDFLKYISRYFWSYNHDTTNKIIKLDAIGVISHLFPPI
ncbi:hypothetical protein TRFO_34358 [Tritrichomonas foetus]|uniref:Uncharacterized protein n=1 Tax=Tritrichomonas foetus TaxID=1144522 RepID=A0A1J4JJ72_9EUKA|nr:hypothetical protein TRFO_34358 [Tritrichomonas foetus]|eukprot:OHS99214.1 hypothetical protein TRFO_34358 [Tritrichomonas foetus]